MELVGTDHPDRLRDARGLDHPLETLREQPVVRLHILQNSLSSLIDAKARLWFAVASHELLEPEMADP